MKAIRKSHQEPRGAHDLKPVEVGEIWETPLPGSGQPF
jgi:hypothetical protein